MSLIDIGANLTHDSFQDDIDQVLTTASLCGIQQLVITGASVPSSRQAHTLTLAYPGQLFATAGIHPHHASQTKPKAIAQISALLKQATVKAVGETGLDFLRNFSNEQEQISSFEQHIELAMNSGLPMFLHERDARKKFLQILSHHRQRLSDVVVHCFTGDADALQAYLDLDCYIGITGWICDERRGKHLIPLIKEIPPNRLLLETDAPYLIPRNIHPKPRSHRNEPKYLTYVRDFVAQCLEISADVLAKQTTQNARQFFKL